jgi:DNA-binding LytR/AlgR family response regulator
VLGETADGPGTLDAARCLQPDVVCLDLRLPGLDGLAVAQQLAADAAQLTRALARAMLARHRPLPVATEAATVPADAGPGASRTHLVVRVNDRLLLVPVAEIIHASVVDESITIVSGQLSGASCFRTLDALQAVLDPDVFWRVHRAHLVNIRKVREIVPWFSRNYLLRMRDSNSTDIPVSRAQTRRLPECLHL